MRAVFIFLTVVGALWHADALADSCQHRIIFLPQSHAPDGVMGENSDKTMLNQVAESQLQIANYLERFSKLPVFSEQAGGKEFSLSDFPQETQKKLFTLMEAVFPRRFPEKFGELSELQKQKLFDNGGEVIQLMRRRISTVHAVAEDESALEGIFGAINSWRYTNPPLSASYPEKIAKLVYGAREEQALKAINRYFVKNPKSRDAILIYGRNHNFSFYADQFPPQCIVVPPEFRNEWPGQFRTGPAGFGSVGSGPTRGQEQRAIR